MGEQPLPEYGACLLGSFNLTKYVTFGEEFVGFNYDQLIHDIPYVVRAMDNVIDETDYPLPQQMVEAKNKRRMGLGITGLANVFGALKVEYGSEESEQFLYDLMKLITNKCYLASAMLAKEKGSFRLYDREKYLSGKFIQKLNWEVRDAIAKYGIRNSHLISIAPTGTISLTANNVSSGIEPVFSLSYERTVQKGSGPTTETVEDYALREWGIKCTTADQVTVQQHVDMLCVAQEWVDSAVSKTCNVGDNVTWKEFKEVYMRAYEGGAKGCTTFRASGKRFGILNASTSEDVVQENAVEDEAEVDGAACYIDTETGIRTCDE